MDLDFKNISNVEDVIRQNCLYIAWVTKNKKDWTLA